MQSIACAHGSYSATADGRLSTCVWCKGIPAAKRRIPAGGALVIGSEAPWMGVLGAFLVKVYDIRLDAEGSAEFGVGNKRPPVLAWVKAEDFFDEWPQ